MSNGKKLKIGLIGFGKMGQALAKVALEKGHTLTATLSPSQPKPTREQLVKTDLFYDFSTHAALNENLELAASLKKPLLIGTTGGALDPIALRSFAEKHQIPLFHAPNFSIGLHLFLRLSTQAAHLLDKDFDRCLIEEHAKSKKDSPSGTALLLQQALKGLETHSIRLGASLPSHTLVFDNASERITLSHAAKSRDTYASGALLAGEWLIGKVGFFTMEDFLYDYLT